MLTAQRRGVRDARARDKAITRNERRAISVKMARPARARRRMRRKEAARRHERQPPMQQQRASAVCGALVRRRDGEQNASREYPRCVTRAQRLPKRRHEATGVLQAISSSGSTGGTSA